ncbi:NADH:flavin oxidoreductase [Victivallis sp. Marseille-Q1083]|uniref:NADH:flavin oxidoreductase n=1 Tax=Victivallis sp. Marseille-Q1083 TaxID=2717288 RepID=UPI00158A1320|nr:NADH:flavin oxidoreductase [Victivallis sp. Marseille-Q1083]
MNLSPFSPGSIRQLSLRNRFVRSATHEGMADDDGNYTPELTALLKTLADHEVGLIISGHAFVEPNGRAGKRQAGADRDDCIGPWQTAVKAVHDAGAGIFLQLAHAGGYAAVPAPAGPSSFSPAPNQSPCRTLDETAIAAVVTAFRTAAGRARAAGFDGVQIHAAHGYLISQFLSPYYNRRSDAYGGTLQNRSRLLREIYEAVRREVGGDYPVAIKINSEDFVDGGFTADDCLQVCVELARSGLDAVELSGGIPPAGKQRSPVRTDNPAEAARPVYYEAVAKRLKTLVDIPVLLVGGIRYYEVAARLLAENCSDFLSLSRPLIREPDLIRRWQTGDRRRAECITCNGCFRPILTGRGCYCPLKP